MNKIYQFIAVLYLVVLCNGDDIAVETLSPAYVATLRPIITPKPFSVYTRSPTNKPTPKPIYSYTKSPTNKPTPKPTPVYTRSPTNKPTPKPIPVYTRSPTNKPTPKPIPVYTKSPTNKPTPKPTPVYTRSPTNKPTPKPIPVYTKSPTNKPTPKPIPVYTRSPTNKPTLKPVGSPTIRVRKEVRDMTNIEWNAFANAVNTLKANGFWEDLAQIHDTHFGSGIHGGAQFWPWHREYLKVLEDELRTIDPTITIPYWDWTLDAANPGISPIWNRYGGWSTSGSTGCIGAGPFSTWTPCITRRPSYSGTGFDGVDVANAFGVGTGDAGYNPARIGIESLHNSVHVGVGGTMSSTNSPYDPVFFAHHCFIDKLWSDWQKAAPANQNAYIPGGHNDPLVYYAPRLVSDTFGFQPFRRLNKVDETIHTNLRNTLEDRRRAQDEYTIEYQEPRSCKKDCILAQELRTKLMGKSVDILRQIPRTCAPPNLISPKEVFFSKETLRSIKFCASRIQDGVIGQGDKNFCLNFKVVDAVLKKYEDDVRSFGDDLLENPEHDSVKPIESVEPQSGTPFIIAGIGAGLAATIGGAAVIMKRSNTKKKELENNISTDMVSIQNPKFSPNDL